MSKNIVVCCDGTGNEFGDANSNAIRLYSVLHKDPATQVAYYHPGVGTMGSKNALTTIGKKWTYFKGKAFGYGISENVADAYQYLMRMYQPGDKVFVFGFSRGAYTARMLTAILHLFGILPEGNEGLIPYAIRYFKGEGAVKFGPGFKHTFGSPCDPHFLGLWDTVSSVGWLIDPPWPLVNKLPDICFIRHAMAIDEHRAFFRENPVDETVQPGRDLKQVWFAGVHSDIGGSYTEITSGLSKISLQWMLSEAETAGLLLNRETLAKELGAYPTSVRPNAAAVMHNSFTPLWWCLAEFVPKWFLNRTAVSTGRYRRRLQMNLFRRRIIPEGAILHESVLFRRALVPEYRPSNLPTQYAVEREPAAPYVSSEPIHLSQGQSISIEIVAREKWIAAPIKVEEGEMYELIASGTWKDSTIPAGPAGYERPTNNFLAPLFAMLAPFRRLPKANWIALVGMINHEKSTAFYFTDTYAETPARRQIFIRMARSGCLNFFANDLPWMYFNNKSALQLSVKRL